MPISSCPSGEALLDFPAQTVVAASYGYFQYTYWTAIGEGWTGINNIQNPLFLFDDPQYQISGGGTLRLTARSSVQNVRKIDPSLAMGTYSTYGDFEYAIEGMLMKHNKGKIGPRKPGNYADRILIEADRQYPDFDVIMVVW